jgi:hypothetical protein
MQRIPLNFDHQATAYKLKALGHAGVPWESRSDDFPFYTLGKSAYLDGNTNRYYWGAKAINPIMFHVFNDLYREVAGKLSDFFGEYVTMNPKLALPGFHIFPSDPKLLTIAGNWHLDTPHTTLGIGEEDAYAFTVAIELPTGGGGIDVRVGGDEDQYVAYKTGELIIHDGMTPHRIASYREYRSDEYRITLQGHIVRHGKEFIFFW